MKHIFLLGFLFLGLKANAVMDFELYDGTYRADAVIDSNGAEVECASIIELKTSGTMTIVANRYCEQTPTLKTVSVFMCDASTQVCKVNGELNKRTGDIQLLLLNNGNFYFLGQYIQKEYVRYY